MSNFKKDRFGAKTVKDFDRRRNSREEKTIREDLPKIVFSFKDFDIDQIPPGQSFKDWETNKLIAYLLEKLSAVCEYNVVEAQQQGFLKIYGKFPPNSDFQHPRHIAEDVSWAVIMKIKGQKGRVAGHMIGNIFYVVFLDKEHQFYKTELKNT